MRSARREQGTRQRRDNPAGEVLFELNARGTTARPRRFVAFAAVEYTGRSGRPLGAEAPARTRRLRDAETEARAFAASLGRRHHRTVSVQLRGLARADAAPAAGEVVGTFDYNPSTDGVTGRLRLRSSELFYALDGSAQHAAASLDEAIAAAGPGGRVEALIDSHWTPVAGEARS